MANHLLTPISLPRWSQRISLRILQLFGWRMRFSPLPGTHGVVIVYPHTSNWDFPLGLLAKWVIGVPFHFLAKESFFRGITGATIGRCMRAWGGEPIEHSAATGAIERLAQRIRAADSYWLVITPEGTRSYRDHWRSGFYHIALAARVPLVAAYIDYSSKEIGLVQHIDLTGDVETDLAGIRNAFEGRTGLHHAQAAQIALRLLEKNEK